MLSITNLSISFGTRRHSRGIKNLNLDVNDGELTFILGRNGCGKTTLLECIAGIRNPLRGEIWVGSHLLNKLSINRRADFVGLLSQEQGLSLPQHLTIGDILGLWHRRQANLFKILHSKSSRKMLQEVATEYLPHLATRLDDQVCSLSGGEKQLLSLACLRLLFEQTNPDSYVLLLDEHTASLDPSLSREVMHDTIAFVRKYKVAGLAVTHSIKMASEVADEVHFLNGGRIAKSLRKSGTSTEDIKSFRKYLEDLFNTPVSDSPQTSQENFSTHETIQNSTF